MTKKKIRYSELTPPDAVAPAPVAAAVAPAVPAATAGEPAAVAPRAPLDLARALAAARAAEEAARVLAPAVAVVAQPVAIGATPVVAARPTPVRGSIAIPRATPIRGSTTIPRATPMRGNIAIVRDTAEPPAPVPAAAPATAPTLRDRARLRTGTVDLLVFAVGPEWFGVELSAVEEAIDLPSVRHVPEMPPAMLGVVTVRGALTSVYSPSTALGVALNGGNASLVFKRARGRLGIAVDDVDDVHTLDLATLRDTPLGESPDGVLLGVLRHRDALLALVDAEALITACQTVPAMETA